MSIYGMAHIRASDLLCSVSVCFDWTLLAQIDKSQLTTTTVIIFVHPPLRSTQSIKECVFLSDITDGLVFPMIMASNGSYLVKFPGWLGRISKHKQWLSFIVFAASWYCIRLCFTDLQKIWCYQSVGIHCLQSASCSFSSFELHRSILQLRRYSLIPITRT